MTCQKHEGWRRSREWSQESWEPSEVGQRHSKFMIEFPGVGKTTGRHCGLEEREYR